MTHRIQEYNYSWNIGNTYLMYNAKNGEIVLINSPGMISAKSMTPVDKWLHSLANPSNVEFLFAAYIIIENLLV